MYKNQRNAVLWGSEKSDFFSCGNGVKQGGVLSPYLFNLYMDDLSTDLNSAPVGCEINGRVINHLFFADDIVLISPSSRGLKHLLRKSENYANIHQILFNPSKSKIIIIRSPEYKHAHFPDFTLNGQKIDECSEIKYLGHFISNDRSDDADIMRHCRYLYAMGNTLIRRLHFCSLIVKKRLFTTYITNFYTGHLWYKYKNSSIRKAKVAYNSIFRRLLGVPRYVEGQGHYSASHLFVSNNIATFDALLRMRAYGFYARHKETTNGLIKDVITVVNFPYMWRVWEPRLRPP